MESAHRHRIRRGGARAEVREVSEDGFRPRVRETSFQTIMRRRAVEHISKDVGIVIRLADGSTYRLPPDLRGIKQASPGTYRLRSTGEEVHDPDFFYTWTITRPDA